MIPLRFACVVPDGGTNVSPQYNWSDVPGGTTYLAIVMDDEVAPCGTGTGACKHWALYNIPVATTSVAEDLDISTIAGTTEGENYDGLNDYAGPCPPDTHTYKTTIYATDTMVLIPPGEAHNRASFEAAYKADIIGKATYTGTYTP